MADHDALGSHSRQRASGVYKRLALFDTGSGSAHECRGCTQRFGGELERAARARTRFVEQQRDVTPHQRSLLRTYVCEAASFPKKRMNIPVTQRFDIKQRTGKMREVTLAERSRTNTAAKIAG